MIDYPPGDVAHQREGGFTLIRLLVTVAIIGILLAAASPNIATVTSVYGVRAGARELYSELENARMAAVTMNLGSGCSLYVKSTTTYSLSPASCSTTGNTSDLTLDAANNGVTISSPAPSSTTPAVVFTSTGTASTSGTITVTNSRGASLSVAVVPGGRVKVQ